MVEPLRHRQTKGAETDMPGLPPPRHISTLPRRCAVLIPCSASSGRCSVAAIRCSAPPNLLFPRRGTDQVFVLNRGILSDIRPIQSDFWAEVAPFAGLGNRKSYPLPV